MTSKTERVVCGVCLEDYDEDERCPRALPCFHTFCQECIQELLNRYKYECPNCREIFRGRFVTDFKVNTSTLDFVRYIKASETAKASSGQGKGTPALSKMFQGLKSESEEISNANVTSCRETEHQIQALLQQNHETRRRVLESHRTIKDEITSKLTQLEEACAARIEFLDLDRKILESQLKDVRGRLHHLESVQNNLCKAQTLTALDEAVQEVEETNNRTQTWIEELNSHKRMAEKVLKGIQTITKKIKEGVSIMRESLDSLQIEEKFFMKQVADMPLRNGQGRISFSAMKTRSLWLKELLRCESIFSQHQQGSETLTGRISFDGTNIMVHCLRDQTLPANSYTIKHSDIMSLANASSGRAFLEFGTHQSTLGRVIIDLKPRSKRAENFTALCLGHTGSSYLKSAVCGVWYKGLAGESVVCGDYEHNNGKGGKEVVTDTGSEGGGLFHQLCVEGSVFGCSWSNAATASQFGIVTKGKPMTSLFSTLGTVTQGLEVIITAVSHYSITGKVHISECGILLSV